MTKKAYQNHNHEELYDILSQSFIEVRVNLQPLLKWLKHKISKHKITYCFGATRTKSMLLLLTGHLIPLRTNNLKIFCYLWLNINWFIVWNNRWTAKFQNLSNGTEFQYWWVNRYHHLKTYWTEFKEDKQ